MQDRSDVFGKRECPEPNVEVGWRLMHHPRSKRGEPDTTRGGWSGELMAQKSQQQPKATTEADWPTTYRLRRAACRLREATGLEEPTANLLKKGSGGPKLHECGAQHPACKGCAALVKCSHMKVGCKSGSRCQLQTCKSDSMPINLPVCHSVCQHGSGRNGGGSRPGPGKSRQPGELWMRLQIETSTLQILCAVAIYI